MMKMEHSCNSCLTLQPPSASECTQMSNNNVALRDRRGIDNYTDRRGETIVRYHTGVPPDEVQLDQEPIIEENEEIVGIQEYLTDELLKECHSCLIRIRIYKMKPNKSPEDRHAIVNALDKIVQLLEEAPANLRRNNDFRSDKYKIITATTLFAYATNNNSSSGVLNMQVENLELVLNEVISKCDQHPPNPSINVQDSPPQLNFLSAIMKKLRACGLLCSSKYVGA